MALSSKNLVCPPGMFIAIVSTQVETEDPHAELGPGIELLGGTVDQLFSVSYMLRPLDDGREDQLFISSSYDPTSHLEDDIADVFSLFERISGQKLELERQSVGPGGC